MTLALILLSAQRSIASVPLLNEIYINYSHINGSTYVRACALPRGCAHGRASLQRARVHVRACYLYGNTFQIHLRFSVIVLLLSNPLLNSFCGLNRG